ncbi:MAG: histidinol-phosphate transaminase [Terriglobia bacterium]
MIRARRAVERLREYTPVPEGRESMIRLDLNENTVGCPPALLRALRRQMTRERCAIYPEYDETRAVLAKYYGVSPAELVMTNGVDDAIMLICDTFVNPGDVLAIPSPTFAIYQFFHELRDGITRPVDYDRRVRLPVEKLIAAAKRARWLALANPNNPTGTIIPKDELRRLIEAAPQTLVLVDEAYFDFSGVTVLHWIRRYPNLIVSRTLSKAFGLAGLRLGILFASRALMGLMRRVHAAYAVNAVAVAGAAEAVKYGEAVRAYVAMIQRNREWLHTELSEMGVPHAPSAANFLFARIGERAPEVARRLRRQGILVRDWGSDARLCKCLRITIGTMPEMRRVAGGLRGLRRLLETDDAAELADGKSRFAWFA